jgi:C-terminal processing protease CtpA/Prc
MGAVNVAVGRLDGALRVRWAEDPGLDGLEEGDEIVAVDGVPVDELDGREVLQMLQGPVGTSVEVELARDDDTGLQTVTLQRRFVDPG